MRPVTIRGLAAPPLSGGTTRCEKVVYFVLGALIDDRETEYLSASGWRTTRVGILDVSEYEDLLTFDHPTDAAEHLARTRVHV